MRRDELKQIREKVERIMNVNTLNRIDIEGFKNQNDATRLSVLNCRLNQLVLEELHKLVKHLEESRLAV